MSSVPVSIYEAVKPHLKPEANHLEVLSLIVTALVTHRETVPTTGVAMPQASASPVDAARDAAVNAENSATERFGWGEGQVTVTTPHATEPVVLGAELRASDDPVLNMPKTAKERAEMRMGRGRDSI